MKDTAFTPFEYREYYAAGVSRGLIVDQLVNLGYEETEAIAIFHEQFAELDIDARVTLLNSFTDHKEVTMTNTNISTEAVSIDDNNVANLVAPHFSSVAFVGDFFDYDEETGYITIGHPESAALEPEIVSEFAVLSLMSAASDLLITQQYGYVDEYVHGVCNPREVEGFRDEFGAARTRFGWRPAYAQSKRYHFTDDYRGWHSSRKDEFTRKHNFVASLLDGLAFTFNVTSLKATSHTKNYMKAQGFGNVRNKSLVGYYEAVIVRRLAMTLEEARTDREITMQAAQESKKTYSVGKSRTAQKLSNDDLIAFFEELGICDIYNGIVDGEIRRTKFRVTVNGNLRAASQPLARNAGSNTWWRGLLTEHRSQETEIVVEEVTGARVVAE